MTVNGGAAITNFVFPNVVSGIHLPAGVYTFGVVPAGSGTPIITYTADLMADTEYFVAAIGGVNGYTPTLYPLVVDRTPLTDVAKIRITHLAPFTDSVAATAVDICPQVGATPIITGLQYLDTTGYVQLPPAVYDLKVAVSGTACGAVALDLPAFRLRAGQTVEVIARGLLPGSADPSLDINTYVDGQAGVAVAHFAPFAATPAATSVTVRVNGAEVLTDFVFPTITPYLNLPAGEHLIQVFPTGSPTAVISEVVRVDPLVEYTVAAVGIVTDNTDFDLGLQVFVDDNATAPAVGQARVRIAHVAPFADTLVGTQVDLCTSVGGAPVLNDVPYGASAPLNLPAGLLSVFLALPAPDCATSALAIPALVLQDGQIAYVYAVGGASGLPLQITGTGTPGLVFADRAYLGYLANTVVE